MATASGNQEMFTSRFAFLMASVGFAVGLGNIWRFPYVAGENGGGAFVVVYLACVFFIGVPVLMAELMIGRRGKASPPHAVANVAQESGSSRQWQWVGAIGVLAAFMIQVTYAVVAGWVLWYLFKAVSGDFSNLDAMGSDATFAAVLDNNSGMMAWMILGLVLTGFIIYAGVQDGIERAVRVMMPMLFGLMVILVIYNIFAGGFGTAVSWLFTPDFSKLGPEMFLVAIGQAFFSIGVSMGGMMTFGSYLPQEISITRSVLFIIVADTMVALLAGLVIFPAVFANGLDPASGAGLIFKTLPVAFAQMPGGWVFGTLFFLMLSVAAITSMVGLIESVNAFMEDRFGMQRHQSAIIVVGAIAFFSIFSVLSYNVLSDPIIAGSNYNDILDFISTNLLLPMGGMLIAVFVGWQVTSAVCREEFPVLTAHMFSLWRFLIRYIVPPALLLIFVMGVSE